MKSTVLGKDVALLFAFGADSGDGGNEDPPKITEPPERKSKVKATRTDDDDDDDDDDEVYEIKDPKDRRIRKLSKESSRRRVENRTLKDQLAEKDEEIAELRGELKKAVKVQTSYESLKDKHKQQENAVRAMAIRSAIDKDKTAEGEARSWYDVDMVYSQLNHDELAVDLNDFSVGGLSEQLNSLAEKSPFLVKETSGSKSNGNNNRSAPSGSVPQSSASGTRRQEATNNEDQMRQDFPALNQVL